MKFNVFLLSIICIILNTPANVLCASNPILHKPGIQRRSAVDPMNKLAQRLKQREKRTMDLRKEIEKQFVLDVKLDVDRILLKADNVLGIIPSFFIEDMMTKLVEPKYNEFSIQANSQRRFDPSVKDQDFLSGTEILGLKKYAYEKLREYKIGSLLQKLKSTSNEIDEKNFDDWIHFVVGNWVLPVQFGVGSLTYDSKKRFHEYRLVEDDLFFRAARIALQNKSKEVTDEKIVALFDVLLNTAIAHENWIRYLRQVNRYKWDESKDYEVLSSVGIGEIRMNLTDGPEPKVLREGIELPFAEVVQLFEFLLTNEDTKKSVTLLTDQVTKIHDIHELVNEETGFLTFGTIPNFENQLMQIYYDQK